MTYPNSSSNSAALYSWSTLPVFLVRDGCIAKILLLICMCVHPGSFAAAAWLLPIIINNYNDVIFLFPC